MNLLDSFKSSEFNLKSDHDSNKKSSLQHSTSMKMNELHNKSINENTLQEISQGTASYKEYPNNYERSNPLIFTKDDLIINENLKNSSDKFNRKIKLSDENDRHNQYKKVMRSSLDSEAMKTNEHASDFSKTNPNDQQPHEQYKFDHFATEVDQLSREIHDESDQYKDMIAKSNLEVREMIEDIKQKSLGLGLENTRDIHSLKNTQVHINQVISPQFKNGELENTDAYQQSFDERKNKSVDSPQVTMQTQSKNPTFATDGYSPVPHSHPNANSNSHAQTPQQRVDKEKDFNKKMANIKSDSSYNLLSEPSETNTNLKIQLQNQDNDEKQRYVNLSQNNLYSEDGKSEHLKSTNRNHVTDSFHFNRIRAEENGQYLSNEEVEAELLKDQNNTIKKKQKVKSYLEDMSMPAQVQSSHVQSQSQSQNQSSKSYGKQLLQSKDDDSQNGGLNNIERELQDLKAQFNMDKIGQDAINKSDDLSSMKKSEYMIQSNVLSNKETRTFWATHFSQCSHKVPLDLFCFAVWGENQDFFTSNDIPQETLENLLESQLALDAGAVTCELLEVKTKHYGLKGWLFKLFSQYKSSTKQLDSNNSGLKKSLSPSSQQHTNQSPFRLNSIEELTEEGLTDEKTKRTYINHQVDNKLDMLENSSEDANLKSLQQMRSEIGDIKELLNKKQKQLSNKEQRLKLMEIDLNSRERNLMENVELKVNEHLAEKLKKFDTDSKALLKRMKGMHDNLRSKTTNFAELKDKQIKNWTKEGTSTLKQRNASLEKMNELHKMRIKTLETESSKLSSENEKIKSKLNDQATTISILKNQLKTYDKTEDNPTPKEQDKVGSQRANTESTKNLKNNTNKMRLTENAHRVFERRLSNLNEFTFSQIGRHLGMLSDKIQIGECIQFEQKKYLQCFMDVLDDSLFMTEKEHGYLVDQFVHVSIWTQRTKIQQKIKHKDFLDENDNMVTLNFKHQSEKLAKSLNSRRPMLQLFQCSDTHSAFVAKIQAKLKQMTEEQAKFDLLLLLSLLASSSKIYESVVKEITSIFKTMDLNELKDISFVFVILNQLETEEMRTMVQSLLKQNSDLLVEELNSALALGNLMVLTQRCKDQDSQVLVLILWQKLSEHWVNTVFEEEANVELSYEEDQNKILKGDKKSKVQSNLQSVILIQNIKNLIIGFKKKLGIRTGENEFVQANYESLCNNLIRLEIIEEDFN